MVVTAFRKFDLSYQFPDQLDKLVMYNFRLLRSKI